MYCGRGCVGKWFLETGLRLEAKTGNFPKIYSVANLSWLGDLPYPRRMNSDDIDRYVSVEFKRFKAFQSFRVDLLAFNVLVGPNNAGKSTIIAAFRILAEAMRRAASRKAEPIQGPNGRAFGHPVDLKSAFVAEENLFFDYHDDEPALIRFLLKSGNSLTLYFSEQGACFLIADAQGCECKTPSQFKRYFRCKIGFAPVLSPVDHNENLYQAEAARLALLNYQASRNFRNIWHHYPEDFDKFKELIEATWPGMSVEKPEIEHVDGKTYLFMYCPEKRRPREIFWSGFGFQIWCQMLTHIIKAKGVSIFLIDEPDVYLHSDLQRQLVSILKDLEYDIILATHSTEIITECDADEIVLISKSRSRARRLRSPSDLEGVFSNLGSLINPVLTQLAKTRRVLFVEGLDFKILGQFARKLGQKRVASRSDFAIVPTEGFNPEKVKSLKRGMEHPLGRSVAAAVILDRDYRSTKECAEITDDLKNICRFSVIHNRKEIENFVLVPAAIDRLAATKVEDRRSRGASIPEFESCASTILHEYADAKRSYLMGQFIEKDKAFERSSGSRVHESTLLEEAVNVFEARWRDVDERLKMISGKEALSALNAELQSRYKVSVTASGIIEAMRLDEVPDEMRKLISNVATFTLSNPAD